MNITFKQGIIKYPITGSQQNFLTKNGDNVNLVASNGSTLLNIAHGNTNYIYEEFNSIINAWIGPFIGGNEYWLYWNIDTLSGIRTFGYTSIQPINSISAPTSPTTGQHWFDLSTNKMMVWETSIWRNVIRVFAAHYNGVNFTSQSSGIGTFDYAGSQVGITATSSVAGKILFFNSKPVLQTTREFFTTESIFNVNGSNIDTLRLESSYTIVKAEANLSEFRVIKYTSDGVVNYAQYSDADSVLGIITENVIINGLTNITLDGVVVNPTWSWATIGQNLWVDTNGLLVNADPHTTDIISNPTQYQPIAKVLSPISIIFDPNYAISLNVGTTTNDEVDAINVTFTSSTGIISSNVKTALDELNTNKANLTGAIYTGEVLLAANPTCDFAASTKLYVDNSIGDIAMNPNMTPTLDDILYWDSVQWINKPLALSLTDLTDVVTPLTPNDGDILYYESSTTTWKTQAISNLSVIDGGTF